jgi:branched-chain amino acid transport system substrate-binding protein
MRRAIRLLALAVAAIGLAAWTPFGSDKITLGAVVQMTGPLANTGRYYRDAYRLTVDTINAKGGIKVGGKQYRLDLKLLDNKSEHKQSARLYERLLGRRYSANFLLGPYASDEALAAAVFAEQNQVPIVQAGGASTRIFSRGYKNVFGTLPAAGDYFRSTIEMLRQLEPQASKVALVSGNDSFDITLAEGTIALLREAGLEVVLHQQYSEDTPNFYNILTLIGMRSPDVILWSGHEPGAIRFIREAKNRHMHPKLLASFTSGVTSANFRTTLGKDADHVFSMTPWLPSERLKDRWFGDAMQFVSAYEKKFRYPPDYHAAAAAAAVEAYAMALEAAGSLDRKLVRDALAKVDFESVYGRVRFGENGQIVMPQTVIQVQDGKVVEIFTDRFINRPVYPAPVWEKRS